MVRFIKTHARLCLSIAIIILLILSIFLFFNKPGESKLLPPCLFNSITNLYCPGCGTTRMFYCLLHLDIYSAFRCNMLAMICLPIIIYSFISFSLSVYSKGKINLPTITYSKGLSISLVVSIIVFMVLRNIPFEPFSWLAPIDL